MNYRALTWKEKHPNYKFRVLKWAHVVIILVLLLIAFITVIYS